VRGNQLRIAFPLSQAEAFTNSLLLLSTIARHNNRVWPAVHTCTGTWRPGDTLFVATDVLAQWFLAEYEAQAIPWELLGQIREQREFGAVINALRGRPTIRNDDATLLRMALVD
jgi:hypothetical protein